MQPLGVASAGHHPPGELVDDHDFVIANDIVLIALEELVGPQGLIDVVNERRVGRLVKRPLLHDAGGTQQLFGVLIAGLGEIDSALLLVELVFVPGELRDDRIGRNIEVGTVLRRARDDERRAGFVNQDRVDLVDNGERMAALHHLRHVVLHVVAQIVEAELVVRAISDVGRVSLAALVVVKPMDDDADCHAEKLVDLRPSTRRRGERDSR